MECIFIQLIYCIISGVSLLRSSSLCRLWFSLLFFVDFYCSQRGWAAFLSHWLGWHNPMWWMSHQFLWMNPKTVTYMETNDKKNNLNLVYLRAIAVDSLTENFLIICIWLLQSPNLHSVWPLNAICTCLPCTSRMRWANFYVTLALPP